MISLIKPLYCYECQEGTEHVLSKVIGDQEEYACTWCNCNSVINVAKPAKAV
ncbi:hypothetical protein CPT_Moonbeam232 [Bacillus phage Moonbeam]|uniref:Uncharacterized protein n=1 Tax=Bacillus phage Moonbeam TaxID=1540091 RepID=A0A0A0RNF0_9CAUD|nr:hypothetical protein CPT_Moonbeam1 [Bacillus phage Moonbeam]YP_009151795.1 hypothetical protein CPT_Moonbeam232 [Bacillus phage Moonbeam]AIW03399.1 hypothetical protein CPT_Moonbeam1 [Bacillus phage Moonbeam]AIW03630.1 hypothetical protein CPT_Moonbeam232 [Bacillus phage Moonbeam]